MKNLRALQSMACLTALAACSQYDGRGGSTTQSSAKPAPIVAPAPAGAPGVLSMAAVNDAQFAEAAPNTDRGAGAPNNTLGGNLTAADTNTSSADVGDGKTTGPLLLKAEVLMDRAQVSPGVIDGRMGQNVQNALSAYQQMHGLTTTGDLDQATWTSLTGADQAPVLKPYILTPQDVAGPWSPAVGEDFVKMSQQPALGYTSSRQMLAERFHMDEQLLTELNPGADLTKAGTRIVVVDPGEASLPEVKTIEVDKNKEEVTAFDANHRAVGVFPATVGSTTRPSPKGTWKVKGVRQNPDYHYNPAKLTWGPKDAGKLHIPPGPNNPVGVVWIALTAPDYGIHGSPDPHVIGKTASHGCVRLTNWDAEALSRAVRPGVKVTFLS